MKAFVLFRAVASLAAHNCLSKVYGAGLPFFIVRLHGDIMFR